MKRKYYLSLLLLTRTLLPPEIPLHSSQTLRWLPVDYPFAAWYRIYLGKTPEILNFWATTTEPQLEIPKGEFGAEFYWRVETIDGEGRATLGELQLFKR